MEREIKFRLRDQHNNIVGYEKWFSGTYNKEEERYITRPCWKYSYLKQKPWYRNIIEHRNKDQFTGLYDKNGKEVFEGDILKFALPLLNEFGEAFTTAIVGFVNGCFILEGAGLILSTCVNFGEVIGNIHKNTELLNQDS